MFEPTEVASPGRMCFSTYVATVDAIADFPTPVPASSMKYLLPDSKESIISLMAFS